MKITHVKRTVQMGAVLAAATLALVACSAGVETSGSHGSRVEFYNSVEALTADSSVVVVGTVVEQRSVTDIDPETPFTISTIEVVSSEKGDGAASPLEVRQLGSSEESGPAPLLESGETYLLFLTPSGLDGDLASQFYVTGGNAGIYVAPQSAARSTEGATATTFEQVEAEEGDELPAQLNPGELP